MTKDNLQTSIRYKDFVHLKDSKQMAVLLKSDKVLMSYVRLMSHLIEMGLFKQN